MKNKGFTVVEFAVSFCLIAAIALLLFQIILSLKTLYLNGNIKTTLLTKQGIMLQRINDDYDNDTLKTITSCGLSCLTFYYENKGSINLEIDPYNKTITYDDYTMLLDVGSEFGDINVTNYNNSSLTNASINNSILTIDIPIYNSLLNENFDIKINLPYKSSETYVHTDININNVDIVLDGMTIPIVSLSGINGYYAEIFSHDVTTTKELFTSLEEFKRSETATKVSALFALDLFKGRYNTSLNTDVFEFVLRYPVGDDSAGSNHWYQSSNFLKSDLENYTPISISWNNKWNSYGHFIGFNEVTEDDTCGFVNSNDEVHQNCYTTIGAKKLIDGAFKFHNGIKELSATSMKLYVRCDEYIEKYALANVIK